MHYQSRPVGDRLTAGCGDSPSDNHRSSTHSYMKQCEWKKKVFVCLLASCFKSVVSILPRPLPGNILTTCGISSAPVCGGSVALKHAERGPPADRRVSVYTGAAVFCQIRRIWAACVVQMFYFLSLSLSLSHFLPVHIGCL